MICPNLYLLLGVDVVIVDSTQCGDHSLGPVCNPKLIGKVIRLTLFEAFANLILELSQHFRRHNG